MNIQQWTSVNQVTFVLTFFCNNTFIFVFILNCSTKSLGWFWCLIVEIMLYSKTIGNASNNLWIICGKCIVIVTIVSKTVCVLWLWLKFFENCFCSIVHIYESVHQSLRRNNIHFKQHLSENLFVILANQWCQILDSFIKLSPTHGCVNVVWPIN